MAANLWLGRWAARGVTTLVGAPRGKQDAVRSFDGDSESLMPAVWTRGRSLLNHFSNRAADGVRRCRDIHRTKQLADARAKEWRIGGGIDVAPLPYMVRDSQKLASQPEILASGRLQRPGIEKRYRMAVLAGSNLPILQSKRRYSSVGRAADSKSENGDFRALAKLG